MRQQTQKIRNRSFQEKARKSCWINLVGFPATLEVLDCSNLDCYSFYSTGTSFVSNAQLGLVVQRDLEVWKRR